MFVRIMRDEGYDFYRQDKYCENMFAKFFDISDFEKDRNLEKHFELLTAFEVFEHLKNPLDEISNMFFYSDTILFTTEMYKEEYFGNTRNWWYFSPATGQHISFYSKETFEYISKKLSCTYYNDQNIHLLTYKKFNYNPLAQIRRNENIFNSFVRRACGKVLQLLDGHPDNIITVKGKLPDDFEYVKKKSNL